MQRPPDSRRAAHPSALLAGVAALALAGCAGSTAPTDDAPLPSPVSPDTAAAAGSGAGVRALLAEADRAQSGVDPAAFATRPARPRLDLPAPSPDAPASPDATPGTLGPGTPADSVSTASPPPPAGVPTAESATTLATRLAAALRTGAGGIPADSTPPGTDLQTALRLATVEALAPGSAAADLATVAARLSPRERSTLDALRAVLAAGVAPPVPGPAGVAGGSIKAFASALAEQAAVLAGVGSGGLTIAHATVCRRVEAFGRFTPFSESGPPAFLAGRPQTVLVYVEVEGFGHTPRTGTGLAFSSQSPNAPAAAAAEPEWSVDLTQTVEGFASDGTLILQTPEATSRDVSRRKRRDHYLVQRVELPATLSPGAYTLKVRVRDRHAPAPASALGTTPANTGGEAEAVIPFTIVADAKLLR